MKAAFTDGTTCISVSATFDTPSGVPAVAEAYVFCTSPVLKVEAVVACCAADLFMHLTVRACNRGAVFAAASIFETLAVFESKAGIT